MKVKRFVAADMRRALDLVRQEMGPDAVILSSTRTKQGVEIITSSDGTALTAQPAPTHRVKAGPAIASHVDDEIPMGSDIAWGEESIVGRLRKREQAQAQLQQREQQRQRSPQLQTPTAMERPIAAVAQPVARVAPPLMPQASIPEAAVPETIVPTILTEPEPIVDRVAAAEPSVTAATATQEISNTEAPQPVAAPVTASQPVTAPAAPAPVETVASEPKAAEKPQTPLIEPVVTRFAVTLDPEYFRQFEPEPARQTDSAQHDLQALKLEITDMRELLEVQLERLANAKASTPVAVSGQQKIVSTVAATIDRRLQRLGLPKEFRDSLLAELKAESSLNDAWTDVLATLAHQLPIYRHKILSRGGIYAVVGSSDAGKTATVCKMAARYVLDYGPKGVAIIRFADEDGAKVDSLSRVGQILQVPVHTVTDMPTLGYLLKQLGNQRLVLIDTPSYAKKDERQQSLLNGLRNLQQVRHLLVLPANSQTSCLRSSVTTFASLGLTACVLTKVDTSINLGSVFGVVLKAQLPVAYTTTGNDLTQDFGVARAHQLVTKAVTLMKERDLDWPKRNADQSDAKHSSPAPMDCVGTENQMTGQSLSRIYTQ